jgi:hypothetical protein
MTHSSDVCVVEHKHDPDRPRRAVDGAYLCFGCLAQLRDLIDDLPSLYARLEDCLGSGGNGTGQRVSGSSSEPLPINPAVAELRNQICHDLVSWCVYVAEERGLELPMDHVVDGRGRTRAASTPPSVTGPWLARHVDWCSRNRPAAEELLPVVRHLAGRARAMLDPDGRKRIAVGPCIAEVEDESCDGTLYATVRAEDDPKPSLIYCDVCEFEKEPLEWLRFGKLYRDQKLSA